MIRYSTNGEIEKGEHTRSNKVTNEVMGIEETGGVAIAIPALTVIEHGTCEYQDTI
jgi:hypothetical protein